MPALLVTKLGGSLLDWPGLPDALTRFIDDHGEDRLIVVVGGGPIVDSLRHFDRVHQIGEERSHALTLRAMDLTALLAAAVIPRLSVVDSVDALSPVWDRGETPVLAPRLFLDADDLESPDPLPHSWDVTSDSIAARLAVRLGADGLILLKSLAAPPGLDLHGAVEIGLVDPMFPIVAQSLPRVTVRDLRAATEAKVLLR